MAGHPARGNLIQTPSTYHSPRLALGYAFARPPIHRELVGIIAAHLGRAPTRRRGLDIGCGAGLSTASLASIVPAAIGLEPAAAMLAHHGTTAPDASFVIGRAEHLPFASGSIDLMTAAGSINYADPAAALPEIARVLSAAGVLVIYDFSFGMRTRGSIGLEEWHDAFERRYPPPPGYELDVTRLPYSRAGLRLESCEKVAVSTPMTLDSYERYAMSETAVELAISRGEREEHIREWCRSTLQPVFGTGIRDVIFDAYIAYVTREGARRAQDA